MKQDMAVMLSCAIRCAYKMGQLCRTWASLTRQKISGFCRQQEAMFRQLLTDF